MIRNVVILIFIFGLAASSGAQEYRGAVSAEFDILPWLEGEAEIELRRSFYPDDYFNRTFQGSLACEITKRWEIGAMYSYSLINKNAEFREESGDENSDKHKFAADITFQPKRFDNDIRFTYRFRYQHATVDDKAPKDYLRNRLKLDYRISSMMNPYIAVEPYYRLNSGKINIIRAYIGNEMRLFGNEIEFYYIAEIHLKPRYNTAQYILGVKFELDFKK